MKELISDKLQPVYKYIEPEYFWTIVIPTSTFGLETYNVQKTTINSIVSKTKSKYEIIVIESNSKDPWRRMFYEYCCGVGKKVNLKYVYVQEPFNHNKMYNMGINLGRGSHYVLMNGDVEVITEDWLGKAEYWFEYNKKQVENKERTKLGILSVQTFNYWSHESDGTTYINDNHPHRKELVYAGLSPWCMLMSREGINAIGGNLDERFISWYQDSDMIHLSGIFAGMSNGTAQDIRVDHKHSGAFVRGQHDREENRALTDNRAELLTGYNRYIWYDKWEKLGYADENTLICKKCCGCPGKGYLIGGVVPTQRCKHDGESLILIFKKHKINDDALYGKCPKCNRVYMISEVAKDFVCINDETHTEFVKEAWWVGPKHPGYDEWKKSRTKIIDGVEYE